jgi:sulfur relay protein TusB/DsrH
MSASPRILHQVADALAVQRLLRAVQSLGPDDSVLLIEDAVTAAGMLVEVLPKKQLFGLQMDAETAGVALIDDVQWLDDPQWLALIDRHARCVVW